MRENATARGRRLLREGRLTVTHVDGDLVTATCKGESGNVHALGHHPNRGWYCSCEARSKCAHLVALWTVAVREAD